MAPEPRRLYRDPQRGMVGGIAAGLAEYLGVDATVMRIVWVVLVFATAGTAILAYLVFWLLIPLRPQAAPPPPPYTPPAPPP